MKPTIIALALLLAIAAPAPVEAANPTFFGPIVPAECKCDAQPVLDKYGNETGDTVTSAPDFGCVMQTVQNAINFAVSFAVIIFILYTAYAGLRLITSGGSSEARTEGKTRLLNVMIGLVVLLSAWLIVDFVMKTLYNDAKFGPWNAILSVPGPNGENRCIVAKESTGLVTGSVAVISGPDGTPTVGGNLTSGNHMNGTTGCPTCTSLKQSGLSCIAKSCNADPGLVNKLAVLKSNYSGSWTITEGYPPSRKHQNSCHEKGTCVDADFLGGGYTKQNFEAFGAAARKAGIRAVFESSVCSEVAIARSAGVEAECYGRNVISGSHFSLYGLK